MLRRPTVGAIDKSRYRNMRELRPRSGGTVSIRMVFVFDTAQQARPRTFMRSAAS
ncbi:type II toxin-antitoxin system RelE/ParE family toxin [Streptomyces sasae]|uniref:type II toxin-antitoxin system RelE/ParE family toxin n=1 Tax=Streptomyces sasae TaxID=1266772 RepID=UPI00292E9778|nr:type II toxin-antitoxin system RelE/ParE family toxin [Streptomyces sasae]